MAFGFGTGKAGTATAGPGHIKPSDRVSVNSHDGAGTVRYVGNHHLDGKARIGVGFGDDNNNGDAGGSRPTSHLKHGARVSVHGYDCVGSVRFVGNHHLDGAPRIGIELDDAIGKNNGTIKGHHYFTCTGGHGLLVKPDKVRQARPLTGSVTSGFGFDELDD